MYKTRFVTTDRLIDLRYFLLGCFSFDEAHFLPLYRTNWWRKHYAIATIVDYREHIVTVPFWSFIVISEFYIASGYSDQVYKQKSECVNC